MGGRSVGGYHLYLLPPSTDENIEHVHTKHSDCKIEDGITCMVANTDTVIYPEFLNN